MHEETIWLIPQIISHVSYLFPLAVSMYFGRVEVYITLVCMLCSSIHYHVCLASNLCIGSFADSVAVDYTVAMTLGIVVTLQFAAYPAALSTSCLILFEVVLFWCYPVIADNYGPTALLLFLTAFYTLGRPMFLGKASPYPGGLLGYAGLALSIASIAMFIFPRSATDSWYNIGHSIWHFLSGITLGISMLILAHIQIRPNLHGPWITITQFLPEQNYDELDYES